MNVACGKQSLVSITSCIHFEYARYKWNIEELDWASKAERKANNRATKVLASIRKGDFADIKTLAEEAAVCDPARWKTFSKLVSNLWNLIYST